MRFNRKQHLRRTHEFLKVRNTGTLCDCGAFLVRILLADTDAKRPRLGVIASRRVGNAVKRNRAKRLLRELFRQHQDRLPENAEVLLIARAPATRSDFRTLEPRYLSAIEKCLNRL